MVLSTVTIRTNLWEPPGDGWREKEPVVAVHTGPGRHRPTGGSRLVPRPSGCTHRTAQAPCQGGEGSRRGSWGRGPRPGQSSEGGPHTSPTVTEAGGGVRPSSSIRALSGLCGEDTMSPPSGGGMGADGQTGGAGALLGEHVQRLCSRWRNLKARHLVQAQRKVYRTHGTGTPRETPQISSLHPPNRTPSQPHPSASPGRRGQRKAGPTPSPWAGPGQAAASPCGWSCSAEPGPAGG